MALLHNESTINRRLALLIANSKYEQQENRLDGSIAKATELNVLLTDMNFEVTFLENVEKSEKLLECVIRFCETIQNDDFVLIFISGHGCQVDGTNYLIPTMDRCVSNDRDIQCLGTPIATLFKWLKRKNIFRMCAMILDCCRPYNLSSDQSPFWKKEGLTQLKAPPNMLIQFACAANKTTTSNLYMEYLLRNIVEPDVKIIDIFKNVRDDVYRASYKTQKPFTMYTWDEDEEVFLRESIHSRSNIPRHARWNTKGRCLVGNHNNCCSSGSLLDQLNCPRGIFLTPSKALLVADSLNHRIMRFKNGIKEGQRVAGRSIAGYGYNMLWEPKHVIFYQQQRKKSYIICDTHNRRVVQMTLGKNNKSFKTIINDIVCSGIAVDEDGFLYISDSEYHEVKRYSPTGRSHSITVAGGHGQGSRPNQLNHPTYLFIGLDKSIYVSDSWNNRVVKWKKGAKEGIVVAGGNGKGKNLNQLDCPAGIAVDSFGTVYVADHWNHRVMRWQKSTSQGDLIIGNPFRSGDGPKQLNSPEGLVFDDGGALYIADSYNHRIQKYDILYVSDSCNNHVAKRENGAKEGAVVAGGNGKGKNLNQLDCPAGIVVDRFGTVYVAGHWNHRVMRWCKGASAGDTASHPNGPHCQGFDENGNLYVADSDNH
ncbi:unnamed protein product [Adineta ricciae]|uniref:Caspase family p20 domain-containing protein n=1 Tax=Adineta ricciae TaxID=249248 RepID=A0A814PF53_ADIRI|nr:unnamed protein product [Adineta ricciae]